MRILHYLIPFGLLSRALANERFDEELIIKPLADGRVLSRFSFEILLQDVAPRNPETLGFDDDSQHYRLFPLALGQILREYAVTEIHLTLNAGKWDYRRWGSSEESSVGTGAELWAWMGDGGPMSIDKRWLGLRNALAGLFCASLASMDDQRTTSPQMAFAPEGALPAWNNNFTHIIRHASLPSEHVCTENLTPFLKLLPCKSLSGIASLLNPHKVFDADWHGMGVHVRWDPESGVHLKMAFQVVSDPMRISGRLKQDWSFQSLFDRTISRSCAVASSSQVLIDLPVGPLYKIEPEPHRIDGNFAVYNSKDFPGSLEVKVTFADSFQYPLSPSSPNPIHIQRTLSGASQAHGKLDVYIENTSPSAIQLIYLETMPWLIQFFLHTMHISAIDNNGHLIPRSDLISNISYIPPIPHARPATFESIVTVPGSTTLQFSIDVNKAFLRYTEHPPDAQRGWDLPPAIFVPILSNVSSSVPKRIYTPILLVDLATPDFSMPYNVIIFTCTLIAFIFGSVFNVLTRKFVLVELPRD